MCRVLVISHIINSGGAPLFNTQERGLGNTLWPKQQVVPIKFDRQTKFNIFIIKESFLNLNNTLLMRIKK